MSMTGKRMLEYDEGCRGVKAIPIRSARLIAEEFDYDQVIIIARKTGDQGGEHVTTYGVNKEHCGIAARCGNFLKYKVMGWHKTVNKNGT